MRSRAESDFLTRILNFLQDHPDGCTFDQIKKRFNTLDTYIHVALQELLKQGTAEFRDGKWFMKKLD